MFFVQPLFWSFISFQNKNFEIPLYDTLKSLIYVVFVDPHKGNNNNVMPFSSPITNAYVELIGRVNA